MTPWQRYSIHFIPLDQSNLERVRHWRNAPHVVAQMAFQDYITPDMHQAWWAALDPQHNQYFIFSHAGTEMGIVHLKDIDPQNHTAEAGIFTASPDFTGTPWPVLATLALMDYAFDTLHLRTLTAKMRADHPPIIDFNTRLGYRPISSPDQGFIYMSVTPEAYKQTAAPLITLATRLSKS